MNFAAFESEPQRLAADHLLSHDDALLLMGCGLGKTASSLKAFTTLQAIGETKGALVVAPLRVCNLTWPDEVRRWEEFKHLRVANLRTDEGKRAYVNGSADIYCLNYDSLKELIGLTARRKHLRRKTLLPYDITIWDELTKAKNPNSVRINKHRGLMQITGRTRRNWGLTGTPTPNGLFDLFAQARLVDNGKRLGFDSTTFRECYFTPVGDPALRSQRKWVPKAETQAIIERRIADISLTLRSEDWLDIPTTHMIDTDIELPASIMSRYEAFKEELVLDLESDRITVPNSGVLINKLLQFTSGAIYDGERVVHQLHDLKMKQLKKVAHETDSPLLVACIYQHEQQRIREAFPEARFFEDAKTERKQQQLLADWNAKQIPMLVAHPASAGHGLNLQYGCNTLVWMSLTFSRELYEQMIARIARKGQTEVTTVHRFICPDTVDEVVADVLEMKAANENDLLKSLMTLELYRDKPWLL